jgi:hypothetical protein
MVTMNLLRSRNRALGKSLASTLRDKPVALMRGRGNVVVGCDWHWRSDQLHLCGRRGQPETRRPETLRAPGSFGKRKRSKNKRDQAMASAFAFVLLDVCGATL